MSNIREMGSKAVQSSWVQRLRRGGVYDAPNAAEIEPRWAAEEEADDIEVEEKSRSVVRPCLLPTVELERPLPNRSESTDLVTETQVIASFGPFQVRTRTLIPLTRSNSSLKNPSGMDTHYDLSTKHKLKWNEPQQQKPEKNSKSNPGVCNMPSTSDHIGSNNQKRDWTLSVRSSVCPDFRIVQQMQIPENCFADQQAKSQSKSLPNIKANPSDAECSRGEQLLETSNLLGGYRHGIEQEPRGFDIMGRYPSHNDIFNGLNHRGLAKQKDKIMTPHNPGSTASIPNDVSGGFHDRNKLEMCGFYPGTGTTLIESNVNNCRPLRERVYLEPDVHSFHRCNHPGLDQEKSSRAQNRDTGFLKQSDIAEDGWLHVKGKASKLGKTVREQWHEKEFAAGYTGYAFQYTSFADAINLAIQERYTAALSCRSDMQAIIPCLSSQAQPVSVHVSAREEEIGRERDGSVKENMRDDKISNKVQCLLSGKEYPSNNIDFNACKTILEGHEFHQFKSRKQSTEEGPTFQRLQNLSNEREAELDYSRHVRLKISSADGQASTSGKRTCCTNKELVLTDAPIVNNIATTSEANAAKASRPEMWLQRWIHSTERTDLVSECEVSENLNCNPLKAHGSHARTCTREWSGNNGQTDFIQWKNNRKDNYISFSDTRPQTWGDKHSKSDLKGSQFMKTFLTSSASAMAVMGTRAKEMYAAQSLRNEIFPVWTSTQCADADAKATGSEKEITTQRSQN